MEHQRRTQASFTRWEQERWRQERESMERWRQEARDHERALFGMFCTAMSKCNAAITAVLKAKNTSASNSAAAAAGRFNITRCSSIIGYLRCAVHRPIRVTSFYAVAGSFSGTLREEIEGVCIFEFPALKSQPSSTKFFCLVEQCRTKIPPGIEAYSI